MKEVCSTVELAHKSQESKWKKTSYKRQGELFFIRIERHFKPRYIGLYHVRVGIFRPNVAECAATLKNTELYLNVTVTHRDLGNNLDYWDRIYSNN